MTSVGSRGSEVTPTAHLSPSAPVTSSQVPAQSDGLTNVSPTSFTDVASTQAQFADQNASKLQSPYISIRATSSTSQDESLYISRTGLDSNAVPPLADVIPTAQSMPPSWIPSSPLNPSTAYSSGFSRSVSITPSLPFTATQSQTDVTIPSYSEQSATSIMASTSADVIDSNSNTIQTSKSTPLQVPSAPKTYTNVPSDNAVKTQPTKVLKTTTWSHMATASPVMATSSIGAGIFTGETTPGHTGENKTGAREPPPGMPRETILIILVPVCVVVLLILAIVLVTCIRRRKSAKKQTAAQNPDLWVNTRAEISLVPQTPSAIETPTEIVPGFKPGDRVYRVIYGFTAQLEGQMTIAEKELVKVTEMADNGWWRGVSQSGERSGWFPGCYVEETKKAGDGEEGPQTKRSRVSSFMLKKRERNRKKSATAVSPYCQSPDYPVPPLYASTSALPSLNSADIRWFNDGRLYRALFAYQGSSKGELSIQEGDILRAWEKDRNGWMHGRKEADREEGWFPAVYVDEIPSDTASISGESTHSCPITYDQLAPNKTRASDQEWLGIEHRALHPYPGYSETDLTFDIGDIVIIYETLDNGWWLGSRGEEVGWLPGSYLEILDTSRDDDSKSDVSSVLSSAEDRSRMMEEDISDITSNNSINSTFNSTFGDPKPKPARRAPPPPKPKPLKPLKIPDRQHNLQTTSSFKSELHNVLLNTQGKDQANHNNKRLSPGLMETPSNPRPKRPAPAPPKRNNSQKSPVTSQPGSPMQELVPTTVATSSAAPSESKLKPGEKPVLPRRFAKPKVIRIPRQSSRLQNLAINSRPSTRPAPPRPPPPKINVRGNTAGKVQSSNSISGKYLKKTDTDLSRSPSNSVNITKSENSLQTAGIHPGDHTQHLTPRKVPPVVLPPKAMSHVRSPSIDRPVSCPGEMVPNKPAQTVPKPSPREKTPERAQLSGRSPHDQSLVPTINTRPEETPSAMSDSRSTASPTEDGYSVPFPGSPVYQVETGPSLSPPVVDSPLIPVSPPVQRPMDDAPIYQVINKEAKNKAPAVQAVEETVEEASSVPTVPEQDKGGEAPAHIVSTDPEDKDSEDKDLDADKVISPLSSTSPTDKSDPGTDKVIDSSVLSPATYDSNPGSDKVIIASPVLSPPTNNLDHNNDMDKDPINSLLAKKPAPQKPQRIPPPTLPKPKIISPPTAIDVPPEGVSGRVSHIIKEIDKFSSHKDMSVPPPVASDSCSPEVQTRQQHPETLSASAVASDSVNVSPVCDESDTGQSGSSLEEVAANPEPDREEHQHAHDGQSTNIPEIGGENCDTPLTNGDMSDDSDGDSNSGNIILGQDIGESDDQELDTKTGANGEVDDVDSAEDNPLQSVDAAPEPDLVSDLSEPYNSQLELIQPISGDTEPSADHIEPSNGLPEPPPAQTEPLDSDPELSDDCSSEPSAPSNGLPEVPNGQSEDSPEESVNTSMDDQPPVPVPEKPTPPVKKPRSPRKERSPVPPARPPPPKSPPSKTQRLVNLDGEGANKKKTLRRAVKSHVPEGKGELSFEEGSFIKEMSKAIGRPGWCIGMLADGTTGLYPQSHVEDASHRQSIA
ncbi:nascent polypeptide-associated complex subunit alpha, muscle-specific form-like [Haliotis rufescens]|uniref:nascent polypeptide-associated complex subunit alpha, muscle-specific form-like n=1 Tax=Haliotis rufescens TaxID=6454 RepID=UPI00201F2237|nr:nascent polypeptide-associated complex subunit alpha, muscle-specific form-like [Haliotis rufescens]XP_046375026.2 nascent polypeptide-associated complex subunit alpha, muscle-specific form-like [Haliotis rufescens]XP_046375027.2 nascent polypeptide-associated complex subunit alpha, muscle-specific form-like [Haliotis rufescens]XP_046375028.2 nascent polypeptide-associated complex subunit alpha, muscle-specific form-like [Haliotis rufescens]XP_046375029.2 nascent polypeptide-associated compl